MVCSPAAALESLGLLASLARCRNEGGISTVPSMGQSPVKTQADVQKIVIAFLSRFVYKMIIPKN
jgi:hypothetical protein